MKKHLTISLSIAFLITCSMEVGKNLTTLLDQEEGSVLYIETNGGERPSATQQDLLEFDYTLDELPNAGS